MKAKEPNSTAVRTALWRALHLEADTAPFVVEDKVGLKLITPEEGWQQRPDMKFTKRLRASILARTRFVDDLIVESCSKGINQYVNLGAGLDTFPQRKPEIASHLKIFEIDQPETLEWKKERLIEEGFGIPEYLHFVPVNFEISSWWQELQKTEFDIVKPALVSCVGVTLYLTKEAIIDTLKYISGFSKGSIIAIAFYLPIHLLEKEDQPMQEIAEKGAEASGNPFVSFFTPDEILEMAQQTGFINAKIISTTDMKELYFANRSDGLLPASGEVFLVAEV